MITKLILLLLLLTIPSFSQQFQLEAVVEKPLIAIFDIDGDGICEYFADNNDIYDGSTHLLKYTFPENSYLKLGDIIRAQNPYSVFPHIDFNGDGKRDLIIGMDSSLIIYDVINNIILFQIGFPNEYLFFKELIDIDGDSELELIIKSESGNWPNEIYKTYIYSTGVTTSVLKDNISICVADYKLSQNYPNPFNPNTTIQYEVPKKSLVNITVYNSLGQLVKILVNEEKDAGAHKIIWDGRDDSNKISASGPYFYRLKIDELSHAKKMIFLK